MPIWEKELGATKTNAKGIIRPNLTVTDNLIYILGVIAGDGEVKANRKSSQYIVHLHSTERIFAETFANALKKINLHPFIRTEQPKYLNAKLQYTVTAASKRFVIWYVSLVAGQIEKWLDVKKYAAAWLKGVYESEGTWVKIKHSPNCHPIQIVNTSEEVVLLSFRALQTLGIDTRISIEKREHKGNRDLMISYIGAKQSNRFLSLTNPCIKNGSKIVCHSEKEVFETVGLPYKPPEER